MKTVYVHAFYSGLTLREGPTIMVHVPVYLIIVVDQNSAGNEHRAGQTAAQQGTGGERGRDWGAQILHAEKGKLDTPCQKKVPHPLIKPTDGQL